MARPRKEGLDYFPHDCDASSDEKFEYLEALYSNDGYAFGMKMFERIYKTPDGSLRVSDAEMVQVLANKCHVSVDRWNQILASALKIRLFDPEKYATEGVLTSPGIQKRRSVVIRHREYSRSKPVIDNESCPISDSETQHKTPERKQNKTKQNKSKENINTPCSPPLEGDESGAFLPENNGLKKDIEACREAYSKNVAPVTLPVGQRIEYWVRTDGRANVIGAIHEAAITGTKNPNYIERVLENWRDNGHRCAPQ